MARRGSRSDICVSHSIFCARDMPPRIDARLLGLAADALAAVLPADAAQAARLFATPSPAWGKAAPADQQLGAWLRRRLMARAT